MMKNWNRVSRAGRVAGVVVLLGGLWGCRGAIDDAVQRGEVGKVREMLDKQPELVEKKGHHLARPLHLAALSGQREVVELLLSRKAAVDARDRSGWTALHCAASQGHTAVAEVLLAHQAEVNALDDDGYTPLHWATAGRHAEVAALLKAHGGQ